MYGHLVHACPRGGTEKAMERAVTVANPCMDPGSNTNSSNPLEDGFTPVRQRRSEAPVRRIVTSAGVVKGNVKRDSRDLTKGKDTEIIEISNSFGKLGEDIESIILRKEVGSKGENKENGYIPNQRDNGKSVSHGNLVTFGAISVKGKGGNREALKDRWAGTTKIIENKGSRPIRPKPNKPMRGLVFGPIRGEVELSANGKRLRVENDGLGRPDSCFVNGNEGKNFKSNLEQSRMEFQVSSSERSGLEGVQVNEEVVMLSVPSEETTDTLVV